MRWRPSHTSNDHAELDLHELQTNRSRCRYAEPIDGHNGIDFSRVGEESPSVRLSVYQVDPEGHHDFYLSSANTFPREALIKMANQFPTLAMEDFHAGDGEGGWFFLKGSIRAGAVDLVRDEEAHQQWERSAQ
jgi:hypothetical protein